EVPPDGLWLITLPFGTVEEFCEVVLTASPARWSVERAEDSDWPVTSGTVAIGLPVETNRVTRDPMSTDAPVGGSVLVTWPAAIVSDDSLITLPTFRLALTIVCLAWASGKS